MKKTEESKKQARSFANHQERRIQELRMRRRNHKRMEIGAPGKNEEDK